MQRIKKNTIGMFDCLKGVIILSVIVYHSFVEVWGINHYTEYPLIWRLLYGSAGVMMGVLFMISGYGFRPVKTWKAFKIQIRLLMKPYFIAFGCSILARIPLNLILGKAPFDGAMSRIVGGLLGRMGAGEFFGIETESVFVFWFFLALLFGWMFLSLIFRVFKREIIRGIAVLVCVTAGYILGRVAPPLPYCITQALLAVGLLYFGYLLKKKEMLFSRLNPFLFLVCAAVGLAVMKFGAVNLSTGQMKLGLADYFGTVCAGYVLLRVYFLIFNPEWKIYTPFMFLGHNSSLIIAIHGFEHLVFQWRSWEWLITDSPIKKAVDFSCIRVVLILGIYAVIVKLRQIRLDLEEEKKETPVKGILYFIACILAILIFTAAFLSSDADVEEQSETVEEEQPAQIDLLFQYEEDTVYMETAEGVQREHSENINSYIFCLDDQAERPETITYILSAQKIHHVLGLDEEGQILFEKEREAGTFKEEISADVSSLIVSVYDEEEKDFVLSSGKEDAADSVWSSGQTFSVLGDSVSSYDGYITEGNAAYYAEEDFSVSSMWWAVVARECGMTPCVINAGKGTGVTELLNLDYPTAGNSIRSERLSRGEIEPDVIFILLGGNDILRQVSESEFKSSYLEMLDRIKKRYAESEVYLCTYYEIPEGDGSWGSHVNTWIREIADAEDLPLLEGEHCGITSGDGSIYFLDYDTASDTALHANARGQELFGKQIAKAFLESGNREHGGKE